MKKKIFLATVLSVMTLFGSNVFAKNIEFSIGSGQVIQVTTNTKDLSGSKWMITNSKVNYSTFVEGSTVVGFKTKNPSTGGDYSAYHTFSRFVYRYELPYTTTPSMRANLALNSQIDSTSRYDMTNFFGEWVS